MDIKLLSGGAADGLVSAMKDAFRSASGCEITGDFGAVGGMRDRVIAGEAVDVVLLTKAIVDDLGTGGHIDVPTTTDIGTVATSVAVRNGDRVPSIATSKDLKSAVLAADAIYFPDPEKATAGIHFANVLRKLDIFDDVAARLKTFPNGQTAMRALAAAAEARPIGSTQVTEILNTAGVALVGALPPGCELVTTYTGAVSSRTEHPELAAKLLKTLSDPANQAIRERAGFGPPA